jgi:hypothetical protein
MLLKTGYELMFSCHYLPVMREMFSTAGISSSRFDRNFKRVCDLNVVVPGEHFLHSYICE